MKAEIHSYNVVVQRRASDANVGDDVRYLFLNGKEQETGDFLDFTIHFYETDNHDMGTFNPVSGVAVGLPVKDFTDMYHILQTEVGVLATFETDENNKVIFFSMVTRDAQIGHGFTNTP
jgi:hypothetical protein